ncbi:MAG: DUF6259 domain-containing protein [Planctomycetota bacterium]
MSFGKIALLNLYLLLTVSCVAAEALSNNLSKNLPPANENEVSLIDQNDVIGLSNSKTGFLIDKKNCRLIALWSVEGWDTIEPKANESLWQISAFNTLRELSQVNPEDSIAQSYHCAESKSGRVIKAEFQGKLATNENWTAIFTAELGNKSSLVEWRFSFHTTGSSSIYSCEFPKIPVKTFESRTDDNKLVIPYRRGRLVTYGTENPRYEVKLPYPGPAAKFQFMAGYGNLNNQGLYIACYDSGAYLKNFIYKNNQSKNYLTLSIEHICENYAKPGNNYKMPYYVVTGPFSGDWWHAARIYRDWWVKQQWASKGLLYQRSDIPDWLKKAPIVLRFSTSTEGRTVENNLRNSLSLVKALDASPCFGVWYSVFDNGLPAKGHMSSGHGHLFNAMAGIPEAVKELKEHEIYPLAYVQSIIYDSKFDTGEGRQAPNWAAHDIDGKICYYGGYDPCSSLFEMCRSTDWWQNRVTEICENAVKNMGFCGIYLDSFGKGAKECFVPNHGHALGGGNYIVQGQRELAQKVLNTIRKHESQAVTAGEAPIEAFRDLLSFNLYAVNTLPDGIPVFRTVWGDYSLGHGRSIRPIEKGNNVIPELTSMFLEGTILGRFFCSSREESFILQKEHADELAYLKKLINYTKSGLQYLRFGEYLHPLKPSPTPPIMSFTESVENGTVQVPMLLNSVTRSHADGSVAIVFANIADQPLQASIPIDPALRSEEAQRQQPKASLMLMDEHGNLTPVRSGAKPWAESLKLEPREIAFYILR